MKFLKRFFDEVQRDMRMFLFFLILLEVYRGAFIFLMSEYISLETSSDQIFLALWTGLRLSLKTAGAITLIPFVFVTLFGLKRRIRLWVGLAMSLILAILFMARFPYYKTFNATFGIEVLHGMSDDILSVMVMIIQEYGFFWRFPIAILLTLVCIAILSRLLRLKTVPLPEFRESATKIIFVGLMIIFIGLFGLFVRFGGSFTYAKGLSWENSAVTTDDFLNECILDDGQAMYRVRSIAKNMDSEMVTGVDIDNIVDSVKFISDNPDIDSKNITPYLERIAKGAKIEKPKHIFIILGESWMQWPMLGKYEDLHIADGIKSIIAQPNAYYSRNFMPNGDFTSAAIVGLVTGLPEIKINVNYNVRTYENIYPSSMARPFKELGYNVDFWYGGTPSWGNIAKMSMAQGFSHFYGYPDLNAPKQTTWGAKDGDLFNAIKAHLVNEPPTVHLIMTTTNHPPYNLDLDKEGYNFDAVLAEIKKLPDVSDPENLAVELGHYWYMDKVTTEFIKDVSFEYPGSLFVITGDHAVRTDPSTHPTLFEHQSVPFVLYGAGIDKKILPPDVVGGHTSIIPTLIELIAPEGFKYYSIMPSMFEPRDASFNLDVYLTKNTIGKVDSDDVEILPHVASADLKKVNISEERESAKKIISAARTIAWWLLMRGNSMN